MQAGKIYRIPCNSFIGSFYCKSMPWKIDNFYYFGPNINVEQVDFGKLDFFYANWVNNRLYKEFEFMRKECITEKEQNSIPNFFRQDYFDLSYCQIVVLGELNSIPCKPEDCIGLEGAVIHDSLDSLCAKLISKITGVPTLDHEIMRLRIPGLDKPFDFNVKPY